MGDSPERIRLCKDGQFVSERNSRACRAAGQRAAASRAGVEGVELAHQISFFLLNSLGERAVLLKGLVLAISHAHMRFVLLVVLCFFWSQKRADCSSANLANFSATKNAH